MTFTAGDNWVNNVIELLKDKWDTENVAKPVIQHVTDPTLPKRHSLALQGKDYVLVYHVSTARENQDIGMYRAKQTTTMSLDINTIYQYPRLDSLEGWHPSHLTAVPSPSRRARLIQSGSPPALAYMSYSNIHSRRRGSCCQMNEPNSPLMLRITRRE